jgi:hypothetical protein
MVGACVVESETEASQSLVLILPSQVKIEKEKVTIRASKQVPGRLRSPRPRFKRKGFE